MPLLAPIIWRRGLLDETCLTIVKRVQGKHLGFENIFEGDAIVLQPTSDFVSNDAVSPAH